MKKKLVLSSKKFTKGILILLGFLVLVLIIIGSLSYYNYQSSEIKKDKYQELEAIAELKIDQLVQWRNERISDIKVIAQSAIFIDWVSEWVNNKRNTILKNSLSSRLELVKMSYKYNDVLIIGTGGELLLSIKMELGTIEKSHIYIPKNIVQESIKTRNVEFSDLYRCPLSHDIHLDLSVPIISPENKIIAVLLYRIEPEEYLYPLIQKWPMPSNSAETLIFEQEEDSVVFLNELRHTKNSALKLKYSLTQKEIPAVQAILGKRGITEGLDYRFVDVIAYISEIPQTPWFMISKVDKSEIFSELNFRITAIIIFAMLLMLATFGGLAFIYSSRQKNTFKELFEKEKLLRDTEEKFKTILYSIGDAVITTDRNGRVQQINEVAEQLTGWMESEAEGKHLDEIFNIVNQETREKVENPVQKVLEAGKIVGLANHTLLISKEGLEFMIADSGAPIKNEDGEITGVVLVFRDQTNEYTAQQKLQESEERYSLVTEATNQGIWDWNVASNKVYYSNTWKAQIGYEDSELEDDFSVWVEHLHPDDKEQCMEAVEKYIADPDGKFILEFRFRHKNGNYVWIHNQAASQKDRDGKVTRMFGAHSDITKQKDAEAKLVESERKFRTLFNSVSIPLCAVKNDGEILLMNNRFFDDIGYTIEDMPTINEWWQLAYPDEKYRKWVVDNWDKAVQRSIDEGTDIQSDVYDVTCKNGQIRKMIIAGITFGDEILATFIDVTDQIKAEEVVKSSERMLKYAQSIAKLGNWELDIVNNKLFWSDEIYRIFGLEPQEFEATYEAFLNHIHPDDRDRVNDAYANSLKTKEPYEIVHRLLLKDGEIKYVLEKCDTEFDADGKPIKSVGIVQDITEMKIAQDQLLVEKEFTDSVINAMPGIFYLFDQNGKFVKWNNTLSELSGIPYDEIADKSPLDFIVPEDHEKIQKAIQKAFTEGKVYVEANFISKVESNTPFYFTGIRIVRNNEPLLLGVGIDISERKQAEIMLRDEKERIRTILDLVGDPIFVKDNDHRITFANNAFNDMFGLDENNIIGHTLLEAVPEKERHHFLKVDREVLETGITDTREEELTVGDFTRTIITKKSRYIDRLGKKLLIGSIHDITERKQSEEKLIQSEHRFKSVYNNSPVSIWEEDWTDVIKMIDGIKDKGIDDYEEYFKNNMDFVNEALTKVKILDVNFETLNMFEAEDKDDLVKSLEVVFATEDTLPGFVGELTALAEGKALYETEMKLNTARGNLIYTLLGMTFPTPESPSGQVLVSIMDISDLKFIEQKLAASLEDVQRSNKELEQFAYVASHDLQEPLRMVSSYTQLLEKRYKDKLDDDAKDFIHYAVDGANRMQILINDLLQFSRITTRGKEFQHSDLNSLLGQAIVNTQRKIEESGAIVTHEELPELNVDDSQLVRLFQNLLTNAIKYAGEESPRIHIGIKDYTEEVQISIKDNGIGIAPEFQERIFEIFERLHNNEKYEGTGIGLAICKRIVERHGGKIWVESKINEGSTFYFTIRKHL